MKYEKARVTFHTSRFSALGHVKCTEHTSTLIMLLTINEKKALSMKWSLRLHMKLPVAIDFQHHVEGLP